MLETILYARDKWLKEGGLLFPDKCSLFLTACEDEMNKKQKIQFWDKLFFGGSRQSPLDLSCMQKFVRRQSSTYVVPQDKVSK
jgi:protein arginine N-methyltransferase 1